MRRWLLSGIAPLFLAVGFLAVPMAPTTVDLISAVSITEAGTDGVTKVVAPDGRRLPYTEANLRAAVYRSVIGKVNPATGEPVGAAAQTHRTDCAYTGGNVHRSCIDVTYYYTGSYIVTNIRASYRQWSYNSNYCAGGVSGLQSRYFNAWLNISTKKGPTTSNYDECILTDDEQGDPVEQLYWRGDYITDHVVGPNSRYHTTWQYVPDNVIDHPIVWIP